MKLCSWRPQVGERQRREVDRRGQNGDLTSFVIRQVRVGSHGNTPAGVMAVLMGKRLGSIISTRKLAVLVLHR
jgi:hypothetical protein